MPHVLTATVITNKVIKLWTKPMWQIPAQMAQTIKASTVVLSLMSWKLSTHLFSTVCKSQMVSNCLRMKRLPNGLLSTSTELTSLDEASTLSFVMTRPTSTLILQPTANSCQHHFVIQVPSQALKSSNVVDKMFTSFVIIKSSRMNLFKTVTVTGITSVVTVRWPRVPKTSITRITISLTMVSNCVTPFVVLATAIPTITV